MTCRISLGRKARKKLEKIPRNIAESIERRLRELAENPVCERKLKPPLENYVGLVQALII